MQVLFGAHSNIVFSYCVNALSRFYLVHTLTWCFNHILCNCIVQVLFGAHSNVVFSYCVIALCRFHLVHTLMCLNHFVSLHCAGSKDAFHCYGASLCFCIAHAPALMEVCACTCSLNSFPLICTTGMESWE